MCVMMRCGPNFQSTWLASIFEPYVKDEKRETFCLNALLFIQFALESNRDLLAIQETCKSLLLCSHATKKAFEKEPQCY